MHLSKDDIKAARAAHSAAFITRDNRSYMVLTKRTSTDGFDDELRREIDCDVSEHIYTTGLGAGMTHVTCAFAMVNTCHYDPAWLTFAGHLKRGDIITLAWIRDNNTDYLKAANLHHDELSLVIRRASGPDGRIRTFHYRMRSSTTPDNSARMVRQLGTRERAA